MEMNGGSSASYLARTLASPCFDLFNGGGNRRVLRLPGEGGDHLHSAVAPSPGHIRCRVTVGAEKDYIYRKIGGGPSSELMSEPCPSFPCFFGKRHGKPPKKQGFFIPTEPLERREKRSKNKELLAGEKNKEFQKNKERKDRDVCNFPCPEHGFNRIPFLALRGVNFFAKRAKIT